MRTAFAQIKVSLWWALAAFIWPLTLAVLVVNLRLKMVSYAFNNLSLLLYTAYIIAFVGIYFAVKIWPDAHWRTAVVFAIIVNLLAPVAGLVAGAFLSLTLPH